LGVADVEDAGLDPPEVGERGVGARRDARDDRGRAAGPVGPVGSFGTGREGGGPDRCRDRLRARGAPARAATLNLASRTWQERRLADLAAGGLTNKEIGERMHLSPRTVSSHLYRVFPK
ncbi:hypothetical protein VM98_35145, partial [Streptomyces rubellomurinus subsp. indigoferus]